MKTRITQLLMCIQVKEPRTRESASCFTARKKWMDGWISEGALGPKCQGAPDFHLQNVKLTLFIILIVSNSHRLTRKRLKMTTECHVPKFPKSTFTSVSVDAVL